MGPNHHLLSAQTSNRTGKRPPPRAWRRHGGAPRRRRRHFERARGLISFVGRRSSVGYARFGATASAARMAFDDSTLESFIRENTMCAAHVVTPNLPPPPEERVPVKVKKPLEHSKYRRRRRGTPPCRDAGCGSQRRFLQFRACAAPSIPEWVDI